MILKLMKKEWKELIKTGKIYALLFPFLFFSILSPVIAKFTPEIIKSLTSTQDMQGIIIKIPPPTWKDAFLQFFKNLNQIVFLVIAIVFLGSISEEKNKGTAAIMVTLGIDRKEWVIAKFLFQVLVVFSLIFLSYILCVYYTYFLFSEVGIYETIASTFLYLVYIFFILSLCIFSSSIGNNMLQSVGIFFAIFVLFTLFSIFPNLEPYNPLTLSSLQNQWIVKGVIWKDAIENISTVIIYSVILITLGIIYFEQQEL